jgi:hypothetical protein
MSLSLSRSPNPLAVLAFGMLMGALTVGLWMWLLEPGRERLKRPSEVSLEAVEGAHLSKIAAGDSPDMAPTLPTTEDSSEDKVSHIPSTSSTSESDPLKAKAALPKKPDSSAWSYDPGHAQWLGQRLQVEAWALLPGVEKHLPPPDLMTEFWSRAVITKNGGVVLLASGHFATWYFSRPGYAQRLMSPVSVQKLTSTPAEALALDTQHRVWEIDVHHHPALIPVHDGCGDLFYSGREGEALVSLEGGELMILDLRRPERHRTISPPPGAGAIQAVLTENGTVWVASKGLWKLTPRTQEWKRVSDADGTLSAMGDGVLVLNDGNLQSVGTAEQAPSQPHIQMTRSKTGIAASLHDDKRITVWGSLIKSGERKHLKTVLNAEQIALGPTGVLVAW